MGDPEVSDLHPPALAQQQVGRLDIAVHQTHRMRRRQPGGRLRHHVHDLGSR
jgi:hypothetical protein